MKRRRFALQPLLEERLHRERLRCVDLAHAQHTFDAAARRFADAESAHAAAGDALAHCASQGRIAEARLYDTMLRDGSALRLRWAAELRVCDTAVIDAAGALAAANRERRTLERLRDRLEMRRRKKSGDDD